MKLLILLALLTISVAQATTVSLLSGGTFRDDLGYDKDKTTMTIENFGMWKYGTVFFYYDITEPFSANKGDSNQFFGGIAPTLSLSRVTGKDFSYGILRDVSIRVEVENGSGYGTNNFRNYFYGLQYDLAVPGFDFVGFNTVIRDNPLNPGIGWQFGVFWQSTFDYGPSKKFKFMGFLATSPWDGDQNSDKNPWFDTDGRYLMTQPQVLYDLGSNWGQPNSVEVGVEYLYAWNRYQLKNKYEGCAQAILKMSF